MSSNERPKRNTITQELHDKIVRLEFRADDFNNRLNTGASSFADLRQSLNEATKPKPFPTWKVISFLFGVMATLVSIVWALARYPDREEFNEFKKKQQNKINLISDQLINYNEENLRLRIKIRQVNEKLTRYEKNLDAISHAYKKKHYKRK